MLHLQSYARYADAAEVPPALTQGGVAEAVGIARRHFAQNVRPLLEEGFLEERTAHVKGVLQRQRVYGLTYAGWHKAAGLRDRIQSAVVPVKDDQRVREATIGALLEEVRGTESILELVRESIEKGHIRLEN